jgi:23S rRNA pseudouridine2604 synthase
MNPSKRRHPDNARRQNSVKPFVSKAIGRTKPKSTAKSSLRSRTKSPTSTSVSRYNDTLQTKKAFSYTLKNIKTTQKPTPRTNTQAVEPKPGIRINKYLADRGLASRREVDVLITQKQITINGRLAQIGDRVLPEDTVLLVGETKNKSYLAYYKGRGVITHSPSEREVDIATRLRKDYGITNVAPVGRLDKDSEGLIILTNDGRITGPLLDPDTNHEKEYSVAVDKNVTPAFAKLMELGVEIEGYLTKPAKVIPSTKNSKRFNLIITEGKKHQIRRMCAALGYQIESLKRVRIMNIEIGALKPNQYRKISGEELQTLLTTLGIK